jgi:hypothetical protein
MSMSGTEMYLPRQRKKVPDVRLQTVEFAVDNHTIFGAVTVSPLYHHMHTYARLLRVRTGYMQFSCRIGITVLKKRPLHTLLYNFPAAGQPTLFLFPARLQSAPITFFEAIKTLLLHLRR